MFADSLNLPVTIAVIRAGRKGELTILNPVSGARRVWSAVLRLTGVDVKESSFRVGDLRCPDGEAVYMQSLRLSARMAFEAAASAVSENPELARLNAEYGRNTIQLIIAKTLRPKFRELTSPILVARALKGPLVAVWLRRSLWFGEEATRKAFPDAEIHFYAKRSLRELELLAPALANLLRRARLKQAAPRDPVELPSAAKLPPGVLMLQEDNIRLDRSLRGQPHWMDRSVPREDFQTYIIRVSPVFAVLEDSAAMRAAGLTVLSVSSFEKDARESSGDNVVRRALHNKKSALAAADATHEVAYKLLLLRIATILEQAATMGTIVRRLNVKTFLIRETYYTFADALQLVAPDLGVETIAYQYTNTADVSPTLLSTADKMLIFSEMYRSAYATSRISPAEFLATGYLYDGVVEFVRERARAHRAKLTNAGASFVVCYFDESVQDDRWGLVRRDDHLSELHTLARFVLSDPTVGVVVKSQFMKNSPSQLYPDDGLIRDAKASGRYLELMEGLHRNDIYPVEAALTSDLCIGHKFGATAALEAAVAGVRTVLIDEFGTVTKWDHLYSLADIEYKSIDEALRAANGLRVGINASVGDWSPIIGHFDRFRDAGAIHRLRAIVRHSVLRSAEDTTQPRVA